MLQDDDDELEDWEKPPWHKRPVVLFTLVAFIISMILLVVGLCIQFFVKALQVSRLLNGARAAPAP